MEWQILGVGHRTIRLRLPPTETLNRCCIIHVECWVCAVIKGELEPGREEVRRQIVGSPLPYRAICTSRIFRKACEEDLSTQAECDLGSKLKCCVTIRRLVADPAASASCRPWLITGQVQVTESGCSAMLTLGKSRKKCHITIEGLERQLQVWSVRRLSGWERLNSK